MKMIKSLGKILGVIIITGLMTTQVFATAVTINVTGITDHGGSSLNGAYVQVIQSSDSSRGAPGTDGLPAGDTVVGTGTTSNGNFATGANIQTSNYCFQRYI